MPALRAQRNMLELVQLLLLGLCFSRGSALKDYAIYINAGLRDFKAKIYVWEALTYTPENLPPKLVQPERLGKEEDLKLDNFRCDVETELCRIEPSFLDREGHITTGWHGSLSTLLDWCKKKLHEEGVAEERFREIPLFVGCSAALQVLPKLQRDSLIASVQNFFTGNATISPFLRNKNFVFLLSGKEEAVYAWLACNSLLGTLGTSKTYGIVTLGRDYAGVAFEITSEDFMLTSTYEVKLTNLARHWQTMKGNPTWPGTLRLYADTYTYLGVGTFIDRLNAKAAELHGPDSGDVTHPCMPRGSKLAWDKERFARFLPKTFGDIFPAGLVGSSNFVECYAAVQKVLEIDHSTPCFVGEWPYKDCGLDYEYRPVISSTTKFLGIRGFDQFEHFLTPVLEKRGIYPPFRMSDLKEASKIICEMDYEQVKKYRNDHVRFSANAAKGYYTGLWSHSSKSPVTVSDVDLMNACALVTFSYSFLVDGLGIQADSRQLTFLSSVNSRTVTVADGLILKHVNQLPWKLNLELQADAQKEMAIPALLMGFMGSIVGYAVVVMLLYFCRRLCRGKS